MALQLATEDDAVAIANDDGATAAYLESIAGAVDPSFECTMRFPGLKPVIYRSGLDALHNAWRDWLDHWAECRVEVEGVIDADTLIVVFHRLYVRRRGHSSESIVASAGVWKVRDHRIMSVDFNVPQAEARAAAYSTAASSAKAGP